MQHIKHIIFCLIIFSNTCFGKEFDELFVVYDPIDNPSKIEKSINNSFNTMIYRLSGTNSPSNIWKIINAGNSRKDFIKSYSIKNIDSKSYLEVNFDKNLLISKFNNLSIPVIGKSRPVILFLINIDSGLSDPYFLTFSESKSSLDPSIQNYLKQYASSRGIFLELPQLDLLDKNEFDNYGKLINMHQYISDKHNYDELIKINISKTGIETWSVNGDIELEISNKKLNDFFMDQFIELTNVKVNELLQMSLINTEEVNLVNVSIQNIVTFEDYKKSKEVIEGMVTIKDLNINKFDKNIISYQLSIFGDINSFTKELTSNNFFQVKGISVENLSIDLSYIK